MPTGCAGAGPECSPTRPVVRAVEPNAALARPHRADDADGLLERLDRLARGEPHPARGLDGVPEGTGADAELDAAAAQDVERRDRAGEDDGVAQRQVRHVERDPHRRGARRDHRQQGPGVEVARLVRVVLHGHEVEPADLGHRGQLEHVVGACRIGRGEETELELVPVVGHPRAPGARRAGGARCRRTRRAARPSRGAAWPRRAGPGAAGCGRARGWRRRRRARRRGPPAVTRSARPSWAEWK